MQYHCICHTLLIKNNYSLFFKTRLPDNSMQSPCFNKIKHCSTNCNLMRSLNWDISRIITRQLQCQGKYAVVILNRPITQNQEFITSLWNNALVRITVDGGTSRWDNFLEQLPESAQKTMKLPDLITGDFDSICQQTLQKYKKKSCKVIHTADQNHTDFTKALMELDEWGKIRNLEIDHVVTICQSSGRIDQILGNIQTLFLAKDRPLLSPDIRLYIMGDDTLSWLLPPGEHIINIPLESRLHKKAWCSLIPVGETCSSVTTTGLKWNLDKQPLKFGGLVSTSNTFDGSEIVTAKCTNTVLWSMKIPNFTEP